MLNSKWLLKASIILFTFCIVTLLLEGASQVLGDSSEGATWKETWKAKEIYFTQAVKELNWNEPRNSTVQWVQGTPAGVTGVWTDGGSLATPGDAAAIVTEWESQGEVQ